MKTSDRRLLLFIGCCLLQSVFSFRNNSEIFTLYRAKASDTNGLRALQDLQVNDHLFNVDFWKAPSKLTEYADLMVPGSLRSIIEKHFEETGVHYNITVPDVEKLILRNEGGKSSTFGYGKRLNDDPILDSEPDDDLSKVGKLKKAKYPFGDYASYADMMKYMRTIEFYYPNFTKIIRIGTTHEGKPIEGLKIGYPITNTTKRAIWIDGNIHAREWASSHTALYIMNQLVSGFNKDENITHYVNTLNFFIVPCLNPDGYEYTRSSPIPQVRLWRKNRSPEVCSPSLWGGEKCCEGVDLNRNFDFHWAETGSSYEPCSNLFHGSRVFSEPEANSVKRFLSSDEMWGRVDAFLTLHTYAQLWIYPFSHEVQSYPRDVETLRTTARRAMRRLEEVYGTQYRMGTGADTLSPASGGSDDWAKSKMNIKYVYLIELRPEEHLSHGFILHKKELIPTGVETFEGVKEVLDAVLNLNGIVKDPLSKISPLLRKKQEFRIRLQQAAAAAAAAQSTSRPTLLTTFVPQTIRTLPTTTTSTTTTTTTTTSTTTTTTTTTTATTVRTTPFAVTETAITTVHAAIPPSIVIVKKKNHHMTQTTTEEPTLPEAIEETTRTFRRPTVPMAPPTFFNIVNQAAKESEEREQEELQKRMQKEKERIRDLERKRDENEARLQKEEKERQELRQLEEKQRVEQEEQQREEERLVEERRLAEQNEVRRLRRMEEERAVREKEDKERQQEKIRQEQWRREEQRRKEALRRREEEDTQREEERKADLRRLREIQRRRMEREEKEKRERAEEERDRHLVENGSETQVKEELFEVHHESGTPSVEVSRTEMSVSRVQPHIAQSSIRVKTVREGDHFSKNDAINIDSSTSSEERIRSNDRRDLRIAHIPPPPRVSHRQQAQRTTPTPLAFRDPNCRDMRYSCGFWLKNAPNACEVQKSFMQAQCAYTCRFCEPAHSRLPQPFLEA